MGFRSVWHPRIQVAAFRGVEIERHGQTRGQRMNEMLSKMMILVIAVLSVAI